MKIWTIENRYRVLTSNGASFGMDRHGHTYGWTYDPDERLGRRVEIDVLPPAARAVAEKAERVAQRELAIA